MAIEIVHSRTATLIDNSNPDEIQAADWNAAHPVTADGMGLLFSNSAGAVAETMTVDMGTLTASTPLTFTQTWNDSGVDFAAFSIDIDDGETGDGGGIGSKYLTVRVANGSGFADFFRVSSVGIETLGNLRLYSSELTGTPAVELDSGSATFALSDGTSTATYGPSGFTASDPFGNEASFNPDAISIGSGTFFELPAQTQTALAQWANIPTNTDIEDGHSAVGVDNNTGDIYLAANVGGTIFKVQLV